MKAIFKKEIIQFFSSPIGIIAMGIFFLLSSLMLWIIEGNYNIPNNQFADLLSFFNLAPWILIFVMSAISMKSFSEEFKSGTIETLMTKPLRPLDILLGKSLSVWWIGKIMLIPTFIYVFSVNYISVEGQNLDWGVIFSSYLGLILLIGIFASIGVLASLLFKNQINAFLTGLFLMFIFYFGFEGIGSFNLLGNLDYFIQNLGLQTHYANFIKGLIKISDIVYFISLIIFINAISVFILKQKIK